MKPHMRAIATFLDEIGAYDVEIVNGGKHPRFVFRYAGTEHQRVVSGTPTNADECVRRAIEDIRRALGLIDHEKRVGERRPRTLRRSRRPGELAVPALIASPQPDWREGLWRHPAADVVLLQRLDAAWWGLWRAVGERVDRRAALERIAANENNFGRGLDGAVLLTPQFGRTSRWGM